MLLMTMATVLAGPGDGRESSQVKKRTWNSNRSTGTPHFGLPCAHVFRLHVHKSKQRVALRVHLFPRIT